MQNFKQQIMETSWDFLLSINNPNDAYDQFLDSVMKLYDIIFPKQVQKCRVNKNKSRWLSEGIYNSIRRKNYLYKKYIKNPTSHNKCTYKRYKNIVTSLIRTSKSKYFGHQFNREKTTQKVRGSSSIHYCVDQKLNLILRILTEMVCVLKTIMTSLVLLMTTLLILVIT